MLDPCRRGSTPKSSSRPSWTSNSSELRHGCGMVMDSQGMSAFLEVLFVLSFRRCPTSVSRWPPDGPGWAKKDSQGLPDEPSWLPEGLHMASRYLFRPFFKRHLSHYMLKCSSTLGKASTYYKIVQRCPLRTSCEVSLALQGLRQPRFALAQDVQDTQLDPTLPPKAPKLQTCWAKLGS